MMRLLALAVVLLAGCDEMARQPRSNVYGRSELFADGKVLQPPPDGTVARGDEAAARALAIRPPMTMSLLVRGRERYAIYCAACHDPSGYGRGIVPARGFPSPPSFHDDRRRAMSSRHIVKVIGQGYGVMYPFGDRIPPTDRWAIAAYIRALQLSQTAPARTEAGHD